MFVCSQKTNKSDHHENFTISFAVYSLSTQMMFSQRCQIRQNKGNFAGQGYSMSPILVLIECP